MTEQQVETVEKQNELRAPDEPLLTVRARTQIVVMGWQRFMGEVFQLPQRFALGLVGEGQVDQVIDPVRPLDWMQNAPGPFEPYRLPSDFAVQGSREGGNELRGGVPGDMQLRQLAGAVQATDLQPLTEHEAAPPASPSRQPAPAEISQRPFPTRQPPARAPFRH